MILSNFGAGEDSWVSLELQDQSINPKGSQRWIFIGRSNAEAPIYWPPDMKNWLTGKAPDALAKIEGKSRRGRQRMQWLNSITNSMDMSWSKVWETVENRVAWCTTVHGITKRWTGLSNWTTASNQYATEFLPLRQTQQQTNF